MCNTPHELEGAEDAANLGGWANPITAPTWAFNQVAGIGDSFIDQISPEQISGSQSQSGGGGAMSIPGPPGELLDLYKAQTKLAKLQTKIGKDQWAWYVDNYRPVELQDIESAMAGLPSDYFVGRASADVDQAFDESRGVLTRDLGRSGVSLSGARAQGLEERLGIARSIADAGARNNTRMNVQQYNDSRRSSVANRGMGIPTQSAGILGGASRTYGQVAGQQLNQWGTQVNSALAQNRMLQDAYQFEENQQLQRDIADQQAMTNFWSSIGQIGGNVVGTALPFMMG